MQRAAASIACSALRRFASTASVDARLAIIARAAGQVACGRADLRPLAPIWEFSRSYARVRREVISSDDDEEGLDDDDDDEDLDDEAEPLDDTWGDLDGEDDSDESE